jgi:signal transduction histidine kinase
LRTVLGEVHEFEILQDRSQITLAVKDKGCGIKAAKLEQVLVPFFTTKRGGSGIGMTIVRQIVTLNGGTIRLHSHPGTGTRASLIFEPQG